MTTEEKENDTASSNNNMLSAGNRSATSRSSVGSVIGVIDNMVEKTTTTSNYRNDAENFLSISVTADDATTRDEQIRTIVKEFCPFLYTDDEKLIIKHLDGGLSNELFTVSSSSPSASSSNRQSEDVETTTVLVRIHPASGEETGSVEVVDREIENRLAAWLAAEGQAPIYYGRFENGRIEEFYHDIVPLSCHDMSDFDGQIGTNLAKFHSLNAPSTILPKPTTQQATLYETIEYWLSSFEIKTVAVSSVPSYDSIAEEKKESEDKSKSDDENSQFLQMLQSEWKWLLAQLQTAPSTNNPLEDDVLQFIREITVTHMDCQSLNILKDSGDNIRFIDFEYAGWNPRAADIANTFCEHCDMNNIRANYEEEYPNEGTQNMFLRSYLDEANPSFWKTASNPKSDEEEVILTTLRNEIGRFTLLSHLGWSIWSVLKSKESSAIDFDYMVYARHRMDGYNFSKEKFF